MQVLPLYYCKIINGEPKLCNICPYCNEEFVYKISWEKIEDIDAKDWASSADGYCYCGFSTHHDGMNGERLKQIMENPVKEE